MFKTNYFKHLPSPTWYWKVTPKLLVGAVVLGFLMGYQPTLGFPPIKRIVVHAQEPAEQIDTIQSQTLPIQLQLPLNGYITTYFSYYHPGVDLATAYGTPIHPVADGTVVEAEYRSDGYGNMVVVDHGYGYQSLYAHMQSIIVHVGQVVTTSDLVGFVGLTGHTTGPHVHFELHKDNVPINPLPLLPPVRTMPEARDFLSQ